LPGEDKLLAYLYLFIYTPQLAAVGRFILIVAAALLAPLGIELYIGFQTGGLVLEVGSAGVNIVVCRSHYRGTKVGGSPQLSFRRFWYVARFVVQRNDLVFGGSIGYHDRRPVLWLFGCRVVDKVYPLPLRFHGWFTLRNDFD